MSFLKEKLKSRLSKKDLEKVPSSFEVIGDIAILETRDLKGKDRLIADAILKNLKNIKVVAKKTAVRKGKYRNWKLKIIGGEKRKETLHKESGVLLKLDVEKCYFTSRMAGERTRINNLIKKDERVLVMFSGVGVSPLVISRNTGAAEAYGIEWNPLAHKYALENACLNNATNVKLFKGDVKKVLPRLKVKFDRIIMPFPKYADKFLDLARKKLNKNGVIHLYAFVRKEEFDDLKRNYLKKFKSVKITRCGAYAPRVDRVCLDLKV